MSTKKTSSEKTKFAEILAVVMVFSLGLVALVVLYSASDRPIRVACVGDSITNITRYPADLQNLLGDAYEVKSYGVIGATILLNTDRPYLTQPACLEAEAFQPQIVVIMLGTNDARTNIYSNSTSLEANLGMLVSTFRTDESHPKVLIATPPPIFNNTLGLSAANLVQGVIPRVEQEATALQVPTANVYTPLISHPEYFPDGVHPNSAGAQKIAQIIFNAIVNERL